MSEFGSCQEVVREKSCQGKLTSRLEQTSAFSSIVVTKHVDSAYLQRILLCYYTISMHVMGNCNMRKRHAKNRGSVAVSEGSSFGHFLNEIMCDV